MGFLVRKQNHRFPHVLSWETSSIFFYPVNHQNLVITDVSRSVLLLLLDPHLFHHLIAATGRTLRKKGALREKGSSNKENNPVKTQDILTPEIVITSSDGRRMHRKMQSQSASNLRKGTRSSVALKHQHNASIDIFSTPVTPATTTITYAEPVMPNTPSSKSIQSEDGKFLYLQAA